MIINTMKISDKIIRNIEFPSCKNCIHFRPNVWNNDFASINNECRKFGVKNVVTDEITYGSAYDSRFDEKFCGKEGKYFEKEPMLFFKKLKHKILRPFNIIYMIPIGYLLAYYIKFLL